MIWPSSVGLIGNCMANRPVLATSRVPRFGGHLTVMTAPKMKLSISRWNVNDLSRSV